MNSQTETDEITAAMAGPEFRRDPYPLYARMRRECPVHLGLQRIWYLSRYHDVEAALVDPRLSHDRDRMVSAFVARDSRFGQVSRLVRRLGRVMSNTDAPEHERLRKLVNKGFTARRIEGLRDRIQGHVDGLVDRAVAAGPGMDLIGAVATPLPAVVICELFGIPGPDRERVEGWFRALGAAGEDPEQAEVAVEQFEDYLSWLMGTKRVDPDDDVISALVAGQARGGRLTDSEVLSTCFMVVTAGTETTTHLIGNGTLALLRNPDHWARLRADPARCPAVTEEVLRYDSPTQTVIRVVAEPVDIDGHTLEPGDLVYLVLAAANRDPARFADPDRFDPDRPAGRNLAFGNGPHFCLGAPLARLEAGLAIGTLARRLPGLRLDTEALEWRPNPLQRRLVSLPLTY